MIEVSYAIGVSKPVSIYVDTFGTGIISDNKILEIISKVFDFRPSNIIDKLDMKKMHYSELSNYGHFGRKDSSFERLDKIDEIKKFF